MRDYQLGISYQIQPNQGNQTKIASLEVRLEYVG